ncbi:MAG TPA: DNA cytosine methyltransferase, partial [Conexibacter sp.]|nr:DNA cytosine methyltransferase [Conexibacter sp.]
EAACATRRAVGLATVQGDVSSLQPTEFAPCWGLIASPPCQAFSMAGTGKGRAALSAYWDAIVALACGAPPSREALDAACDDERAHLVLEPLRWAVALWPRWIACEQVEPVLPLWHAMAHALSHAGYSTWVGTLSAEQYGLAQTRRRAILLASLDARVRRPPQTHQSYIVPRREGEPTLRLFDPGPRQRIVVPEERDLLPWVSMAEALTQATGTVGVCRDVEASSHRREALGDEDVAYRPRDLPAVGAALRAGTHANDATRAAQDPAPTLRFGARLNAVEWVAEQRDRRHGVAPARGRETSAPDGRTQLSVREAAILQGFPADYPWQGSRTQQFQQIGNAIPPLVAAAALAMATR